MKQIKCIKTGTPQGDVIVILRIIGKYIYIKANYNQYAEQIIEQMKSKGAEIDKGRTWMKINIFTNKENTNVKLNGEEFDYTKLSDEEIEKKLLNFYIVQYTKAGFNIE